MNMLSSRPEKWRNTRPYAANPTMVTADSKSVNTIAKGPCAENLTRTKEL